MAPLFSVPVSPLPRLEISFIDVGQGLRVLVRTANQTLLYDAGPANSSFDAGQQIVTPFLRSKAIDVVNYLIVSHGDNDHSGGVEAIRRNFQVEALFVSQSGFFPGSRTCDHVEWEADELRFSLFSMFLLSTSNNASCLLQISGPEINVLLTGDIEAIAEGKLMQLSLPIMDLISAPHHGSASSSTPGLLNKLRPDLVVVSAGKNNRFGHPDDEVLARYQRRHSRVINTADHGAVTISFGWIKQLSLARETEKRFWH